MDTPAAGAQKQPEHPGIRLVDPDRSAAFYTPEKVRERAETASKVSLAVEAMRNLADQGSEVYADEQLLGVIADPQADGTTLRALFMYLYDADTDEESMLPDGALSVLSASDALGKEWAGSASDQRLIGASATIWCAIAERAARMGENAILTPMLAEVLDGALNATTRRKTWNNFYSHLPLPSEKAKRKAVAAIRKTPVAKPLEKLLRWIEENAEPEGLAWLAGCQYPAIVEAVSDTSPAASTAPGVEALAKGKRIDAIARNKRLSEEGRKKLLDIFIERIEVRSDSDDTEYLAEEIEARHWRFDAQQMERLRNIAISDLADDREEGWADLPASPAERISYISQAITEDKRIRQAMANSRNPVVQTRILEVSQGKEWLKSISILDEIDQENSKTPGTAGHYLETAVARTKDWQVKGLTEQDLVNLVAHTSDQVRVTGRRLMMVVSETEPNQAARARFTR